MRFGPSRAAPSAYISHTASRARIPQAPGQRFATGRCFATVRRRTRFPAALVPPRFPAEWRPRSAPAPLALRRGVARPRRLATVWRRRGPVGAMDVGELLSYQVRRAGRDGPGEALTLLTLRCSCRSGCLGAGTGRDGAAWRCGAVRPLPGSRRSPREGLRGASVRAALRVLCSAVRRPRCRRDFRACYSGRKEDNLPLGLRNFFLSFFFLLSMISQCLSMRTPPAFLSCQLQDNVCFLP